MEEDNQLGFEFPGLGRRKIEANFAGGQVSSDGGCDATASGGSFGWVLRNNWIGFCPTDGIRS